MEGVYLLHFDKPYLQARHYIGYSDDMERRIEAHRDGYGAKLTRALVRAGIGFQVARIWEGGDRTFERKLHDYSKSPNLCPLCNPNALNIYSIVSTPSLDGRHEVVTFGRRWLCTCCDQVLSLPESRQYCTGKGYYSTWKKVPEGLRTARQWKSAGKRPARRQQPRGKVFTYLYGKGYVWCDLYAPEQLIEIEQVHR
jgi:hypothetical protein